MLQAVQFNGVINLFKRIVAIIAATVMLLCSVSCSIVEDVLYTALETPSNLEDRHEYTAEAYEFPTQIGEFVSVSKNEYLCYPNLTDAQKTAYDYMYESVIRMDEALFYVGDCTNDDVTVAYHALTYDNPQLIWIPSTYGVSVSTEGAFVRFSDPDGSYSYTITPEERDEHLDMLYEEVDLFINQNLLPTMTAYEIELAVNDWLCEQIEYNQEAADAVKNKQHQNYRNAWTPYGAIVENSAVCAGYATALQFVLNYVGVQCGSLRVKSEGEMHMVCVVNLGDEWSYVDPTWNDKETCGLAYTHDYFNLTYDEIIKTHIIFDEWHKVLESGEELNSNFNIFLPECDSKEYNYYKQSNLQIGNHSEFKNVVTREFKAAAKNNITSLEFQLIYGESTNEEIENLINRYNVIDSLERYCGNISSVQYASLNNGAFCMKINLE